MGGGATTAGPSGEAAGARTTRPAAGASGRMDRVREIPRMIGPAGGRIDAGEALLPRGWSPNVLRGPVPVGSLVRGARQGLH